MDKSTKSFTSKIPKSSGIPRPRSKSGDRAPVTGARSRSFSQPSESRLNKSPKIKREASNMSERGGRYTPQKDDDHRDRYEDSQSKKQNGHGQEAVQQGNRPEESSHYDNPYSDSLPNNIPRYQGLINSKFRQGILASQQIPQLDSCLKKSDYSPVLRNGSIPQNPKDAHQGLLDVRVPPVDNISAMFQRPTSAIPSPAGTTQGTSGGWGRMGTESTKHFSNGYGNEETDIHIIMSPNNNSNIGLTNSYSTAEELDNILAKYKSLPQPPPQQQMYQVYNATVTQPHIDNNGYHQQPSGGEYNHNNRESNISKSKHQFDPEQRQYSSMDQHKSKEQSLGVFGLPMENSYKEKLNNLKKEEELMKSKTHKHVSHKFPFQETADGNLVVHPDQVAFESKSISVLVSDPTKIWASKAEKMHDRRNQENLLKEVEDVIQKGLHAFYDGETEVDHKKRMTDAYLDKEIMVMKYSESKTGTEKLMSDIHNRLRSGRHADTHVVIGEKVYPCHSVALEVVSKYFDNLNTPKESMRRIELPDSDVPSTVFPILMDWILQSDHGRAAVMNKGNVVQLFSCGKYLDISELKSQCVNYLQEKVETNDPHLMALWDEVKKRPNCQDLMVVISAKAALSFQHIFKEKKFLNLDVDELVMLLSSDDIVIESELDVFDTAIQWLLHSWENRKVFTNEVIHSVRFGLLTPLQLTQIAHSPELAKGATFPHEYPELLQYGSVKSMIDDGLAYSIVFESYKAQPEEIKKWVESTGIKAPRLRNHTNPTCRNKTFTIPHEGVSMVRNNQGAAAEKRPSYTVFKTGYETPANHSLSKMGVQLEGSPHHHSNNQDSDSDAYENAESLEKRGRSKQNERPSTKMESVVHRVGKPIKNEDIQNLGPSTMGSDNMPRSRDKYQ